MKIRIFAILLAMLMLASLVACNSTPEEKPDEAPTKEETPTNGGEAPTKDGEVPTTPPDESADLSHLPTDTYNDEEFSIYQISGSRNTDAIVLGELGENPTSLDRAIYERTVYISETYKVRFQVYPDSSGVREQVSQLGIHAKTGTDAAELHMGHARSVAFPAALQGLLYDWNDMELIDLEASYWSRSAREQLATPGGKLFFHSGDANHFSVGTAFAMFFNKEIIEGINGLEFPFDAVRNGEWTFELFETYVTTVASNLNGDGSGILGQDSFSYAVIFNRGPLCVINSTDYSVLTRDEDEEYGYKFTGRKEIIARAVNDYVDLVLRSGTSLYYRMSKQEDSWNVHNAFIANTVCFFEDEVDYAGKMAKSGVEFGILPWPMYNDECEKGYTSLVDAGLDMFCVPINTTDGNLQRISVVLENLAFSGQQSVMPLYYEIILSYQYIKDEDSLEMLGYIHDSLVFDFAFFYSPGGAADAAVTVLNGGGTMSMTTWLDANEKPINDALKLWKELDDE